MPATGSRAKYTNFKSYVAILTFLSAVAAGLFLGLKPSQSHAEAPAGEPLKIIDVHTHARFNGKPERTSELPQTEEEYAKELKEANAVGAVSMSEHNPEKWQDLSKYNVIQCYGVGEKVLLGKIEEGLKSKHYRCIKIYLGYIHRYAYDAPYRPVYKLAEKYKVPVVFHTGDTYSTKGKLKYSHPLTIDEVAVDFPNVTFVIAHMGNPWIRSAAEVAYKNPNVYVEASALIIGDIAHKSQETIDKTAVDPLRWAFLYMEDPTKLMFGTDWPLVRIKDYIEIYKKAIPKEHWRAVFYDNASKVYGIK